MANAASPPYTMLSHATRGSRGRCPGGTFDGPSLDSPVTPFSFRWVILLLAAAVWPSRAFPIDRVVEMFQSSFLPQAVTVDAGDAVSWAWRQGTHTVTSGFPDAPPGSPDEPGLLFDAVVDEAHPSFSFTFDEPREGGVTYFCRQHPGQVGFIEILGGEISLRVAVVDNVFNPEEAFIFEGDSIRWEHEFMEDVHTVTSGLPNGKPGTVDEPGFLFDSESSDLDPIFVYEFAQSGRYPYFCIPHVAMGMNGTVHVQTKFLRGDTSGDSGLNISDPLATLDFLFAGRTVRCCEDALDANDDGMVNIADPILVLNFLFSGDIAMPAPYPRLGADRTEDELRCWE
jgi:plastocyanin